MLQRCVGLTLALLLYGTNAQGAQIMHGPGETGTIWQLPVPGGASIHLGTSRSFQRGDAHCTFWSFEIASDLLAPKTSGTPQSPRSQPFNRSRTETPIFLSATVSVPPAETTGGVTCSMDTAEWQKLAGDVDAAGYHQWVKTNLPRLDVFWNRDAVASKVTLVPGRQSVASSSRAVVIPPTLREHVLNSINSIHGELSSLKRKLGERTVKGGAFVMGLQVLDLGQRPSGTPFDINALHEQVTAVQMQHAVLFFPPGFQPRKGYPFHTSATPSGSDLDSDNPIGTPLNGWWYLDPEGRTLGISKWLAQQSSMFRLAEASFTSLAETEHSWPDTSALGKMSISELVEQVGGIKFEKSAGNNMINDFLIIPVRFIAWVGAKQ